MKLLAIDPGERVGWATGTVDGALVIDTHGITYWKDFALKLGEVFANYDVVVYENYKVSAEPRKLKSHIGSDVPTLQFIGILRYLAWLHPNVKLVEQTPGNKPTAVRTAHQHPQIADLLAKLPKSHDDSHDGDALLHAWYWFRKEYA